MLSAWFTVQNPMFELSWLPKTVNELKSYVSLALLKVSESLLFPSFPELFWQLSSYCLFLSLSSSIFFSSFFILPSASLVGFKSGYDIFKMNGILLAYSICRIFSLRGLPPAALVWYGNISSSSPYYCGRSSTNKLHCLK